MQLVSGGIWVREQQVLANRARYDRGLQYSPGDIRVIISAYQAENERGSASLPSMNFGQRGRMRHRLRAYLPVRVEWSAGLPGRGSGRATVLGADRTPETSRVAFRLLGHAPAVLRGLGAEWPCTATRARIVRCRRP